MYKKFIKRGIDILVSLSSMILLLPLFLLVAIGLLIVNKGKVFFRQQRPGKNEKLFTIIKFKSMNDKTNKNGELLPDHLRLTTFGSFIRTTSLDELPQLINVLKGEMSFIGPRPLLIEYLPLYNDKQKERHLVRPGITGWAQINGRNSITWKEKFELDYYYVHNCSFFLDLKVILRSIKRVISRDDVNQSASMTMEKFNGKN